MKKNSKELQVNKKLQEMSKAELIKMVEETALPMVDPEAYKEKIRSLLPAFVKEMDNVEDLGTAAMESGQEMLLVIYDCLRRYHGWEDPEIIRLSSEVTDVLTGAKEYEESGLSMLTPYTINQLGNQVQEMGIAEIRAKIAQIRYKKTQFNKIGMEFPEIPGMAKFLSKPKGE